MADRLLILGASARAAAASARRAGLEPFAIDLFADADTKQLCDCLRCPSDRYPEGLFELAKQAPPMPWMYTGGLENYPELIGELSRERELWGNGPDVLRQVRNPWFLDGLPPYVARFAEVCPKSWRPPASPPYLRKPVRGSGGQGVRVARPDDRASPDVYYQEFIDGQPLSAVFATASGRPVTLGVTAQLVGTQWLHAGRFQYAGSISRPWAEYPLYSWPRDLCNAISLQGMFGLDHIDRCVVDVNPRYVASVEVHELATGASLLNRRDHPPLAVRVVGKAIYYAPHRLTFPASGPWDDSVRHAADVWRRPDFADVPHAGAVIEAGHPVLTILAEADTEAECLTRLQSRAAELDRLFGFPTPEG